MPEYPAESLAAPGHAVLAKDDSTPGSLPWQIALLERLTGELAASVEVLESRLRPVLRDPDDTTPGSSPMPIPLSTHAGNLSSIAARVEATTLQIRDTIGRLDA